MTMQRFGWFAAMGFAGLLAAAACGDETSELPPTSASSSSASSGAGGIGGSTTNGSGGTGGMMLEPCIDCLSPLFGAGATCGTEEAACVGDNECDAWIGCFNNCVIAATPMSGCFDACDAMHSSAANLYGALRTCMCGVCSANCSFFCMGGSGGSGSGGAGGSGSGGAGGN
jgi:hypothetical protein